MIREIIEAIQLQLLKGYSILIFQISLVSLKQHSLFKQDEENVVNNKPPFTINLSLLWGINVLIQIIKNNWYEGRILLFKSKGKGSN